MKIFTLILLGFCLNVYLVHAQDVATVVKLKGSVLSDDFPLRLGDHLKEGDVISTKRASFIQLRFVDDTIVNLGSDAELNLKSYRKIDGKRKNLIRLLRGKMRVVVKRMAEEKETLEFNTPQVSLGVRGTEFLVNSYTLGGSPSSDVLLIKGSLKTTGAGFNSFVMEPGQYFNSQSLVRSGMKAIKLLSPSDLEVLKNNVEEFLPEIGEVGELKNLGKLLGGALFAIADTEKETVPIKKQSSPRKVKKKKAIKKVPNSSSRVMGVLNFSYNLKKEKWDIQDAVLNRSKNKLENKCFYYYYKLLPGAGAPERFRGERECDEYEYDL
jgi:hypothetical protein